MSGWPAGPFVEGISTSRYFKMVEHFRRRGCEDGESHHIIPRSMGGTDEPANLVKVPPRVHFILHVLLVRMPIEAGAAARMRYALWRMMNPQSRTCERTYRVTSRHYERVRDWVRERMQTDNPMKRDDIKAKFIGRKRPDQVEVVKRLNEKRWGSHVKQVKPKRTPKPPIECQQCGCLFKANRTGRKYCSHSCAHASKVGVSRPAWNKGIPNPRAAANGKKGAAAQSAKVTGRRRHYKADGTWSWEYPLREQSPGMETEAGGSSTGSGPLAVAQPLIEQEAPCI